MTSHSDPVFAKRAHTDTTDRFSALPVELLRFAFSFCALNDLVFNRGVCRAWRHWISHPAALPKSARQTYTISISEEIYNWLGRCGVRWSHCYIPEWIGRALWPPEVVTDTCLTNTNVMDDLKAQRLLQFHDRLRLTKLTWYNTSYVSEPTVEQWERLGFLFSGLHTLSVAHEMSPHLLRLCESLRSLEIKMGGENAAWVPMIQAVANQQFRISLRIDLERQAPLASALTVLTAWSLLRDRIDEIELHIPPSCNFAESRAVFAQILGLRLPIVRLHVDSANRMVHFSACDAPHLREIYWDLWRVIGRAHVESFLSLLNATYNRPRV